MNPSSFDVATLLNDSGSFGSFGTDLFYGEWGSKEDKQILVIEGVGTPSDLKELYEQPGIQILVRGVKKGRDIDVYLVAKQVYDFLVSQSENTLINGEIYKGFEPTSNIAPLGKDENERFVYSANYMSWRDVN